MNNSMKSTFDPDCIDWEKAGGLVPAIVQHAKTGEVLMLAYMNRMSLEQTMRTGEVTFFSRSRQEVWTKGETSGNKLQLVHIEADCDGDTLLVLATPSGPVCHRLTPTCFEQRRWPQLTFLATLSRIVESRQGADPEASYTASLMSQPLHRVAQKVGEEALETVLAACQRDQDDLINEAADLVFHLIVLLKVKGLDFSNVVQCLEARHRRAARSAEDSVSRETGGPNGDKNFSKDPFTS